MAVVDELAPTPVGVDSEIAPLRTVVVHRPDEGLRRIDAANKDGFLFDAVMDLEGARIEHDAFTALMQGRDVEVLHHDQLVAEALDSAPHIKRRAVDALLRRDALDPALADEVAGELASWTGHALTGAIVGGLTLGELDRTTRRERPVGPDTVLLAALPNSLYQRDPAIWIYGGLSISSMSRVARAGERVTQQIVYRHHPRFAGIDIPMLDAGAGTEGGLADSSGGIEGGDLMVLGGGTVVAGLSERSSIDTVERLAAQLFAAGLAERVITVELPDDRMAMHLDTVLTMLGPDVFTGSKAILDGAPTTSLRPGSGGARVDSRPEPSVYAAIADALGVNSIEVVDTGVAESSQADEQWTCGHNYLALAPGVVVGYGLNARTNDEVRRRGVEVLEIEGTELVKGHGGPHCLTAPVRRTA